MEKAFEKVLRRSLVAKKVFTPATPISRKTLFAGRHQQLTRAVEIMSRPGQHGIVFGERGVGKTSLVSILHYFFPTMTGEEAATVLAARVNANADHTFDAIWREIFAKIPLIEETATPAGFKAEKVATLTSYAEFIGAEMVTPGAVESLLNHAAARNTAVVVVIDEFDRVEDANIKRLMADTIKNLSDHTVAATIIIVGVADTVEQLIGEHQSIQRSLVQIQMPRMSVDEIKEILTGGINAFNALCKGFPLTMKNDAKDIIAFFSRGMPSFAHLLGLHAVLHSIEAQTKEIDVHDVFDCMESALQGVEHSTKAAYQSATSSAHKTNLFRQVLTACAVTVGDSMGLFSAGDVREPLRRIMKKPMEIPNFINHLNEFCETRRGPVLQRKGEPRNYRFRFIDPMVEAYVVMRGYDDSILQIPTPNGEST